MLAERCIVETDADGNLKILPKLPPNARIEAIFLVLDEAPSVRQRMPPPSLAGSIEIHDDLIEPAVPEEDWDALR